MAVDPVRYLENSGSNSPKGKRWGPRSFFNADGLWRRREGLVAEVRDEVLTNKKGQELEFEVLSREEVVMTLQAGSRHRGFVERPTGRILWDDGDVWARGLDGYWFGVGEGPTPRCAIRGRVLTWQKQGTSLELEFGGSSLGGWEEDLPKTVHMTLNDRVYSARVEAAGSRLTWSDGEVWERSWDAGKVQLILPKAQDKENNGRM